MSLQGAAKANWDTQEHENQDGINAQHKNRSSRKRKFARSTHFFSSLLGGFAIVGSLGSLFSLGIVFYNAPLIVNAISYEGKYKDGESIYGILWTDEISDLRVNIFNPTPRDYDHLDVTLTLYPPFLIRDQRQTTNIQGVSLFPIESQVHLKLDDDKGNLKEEENLPDSRHAYNQVRLLCDRLPGNTTIRLIFATSKFLHSEGMGTRNGSYFVVPKSPERAFVRASPIKVNIEASYSVVNRPYSTNNEYSVVKQ